MSTVTQEETMQLINTVHTLHESIYHREKELSDMKVNYTTLRHILDMVQKKCSHVWERDRSDCSPCGMSTFICQICGSLK